MSERQAKQRGRIVLALKILLFLLLAAGTAALFFTPLRDHLTLERAAQVRGDLASNPYGPVIFILAFSLLAVFPIPATVFVVLAGAVWGWKLGTLYALVGGVGAASISYWIGRFLGDGVLEKFGTRGVRLAQTLRGANFRTFFLIRLVPGIPFVVFNYGAGVAGMSFGQFVLATLCSILPLMTVFAYSADALLSGTISRDDALGRVIIAAVLIAIVVIVPSLFRKRAEKALHLPEDPPVEEPTA